MIILKTHVLGPLSSNQLRHFKGGSCLKLLMKDGKQLTKSFRLYIPQIFKGLELYLCPQKLFGTVILRFQRPRHGEYLNILHFCSQECLVYRTESK